MGRFTRGGPAICSISNPSGTVRVWEENWYWAPWAARQKSNPASAQLRGEHRLIRKNGGVNERIIASNQTDSKFQSQGHRAGGRGQECCTLHGFLEAGLGSMQGATSSRLGQMVQQECPRSGSVAALPGFAALRHLSQTQLYARLGANDEAISGLSVVHSRAGRQPGCRARPNQTYGKSKSTD